MKATGLIRKPPPLKETRRKYYLSAPHSVQDALCGILEEYSDIFPAQLPKGRPPKREVEFAIQIELGAEPSSKPLYHLSPKEHEELEAQINDLLS